MRFDWDNAKNRSNQSKHLVSSELAMEVFDDHNALTALIAMSKGEQRWHTTGLVVGVLWLLVVSTEREIKGETVT